MIKTNILLAWILCLLLFSCSSDQENTTPLYWTSVIREQTFTVQDIEHKYAEIFKSNPILTSLVKDVHVVAIRYRTRDLNDNEIIASGIIAYPTNTRDIKGITSMQHGTLFLKSDAPSRQLMIPELIPVFLDQIVIMADYVGFGETETLPHPFMHSTATSRTCLDMLLAGKEYLIDSGFTLPEEITLAGYSQGGSATIALLRAMESSPTPVWNVKKVYAGGGVYDFNATYHYFLNENYISTSVFAPYLILGLNTNHQMDPKELFLEPGKIEKLFDGQHGMGEINRSLGHYLNRILHADAYTPTQNPSIRKLEQALTDNTLLDWTPRASITLMHSPTDKYVPYLNAEKAMKKFKSKGNDVTLIQLKGDHVSAAIGFFIQMLLLN